MLLLDHEVVEREQDREARAGEREELRKRANWSTTKLPPKATACLQATRQRRHRQRREPRWRASWSRARALATERAIHSGAPWRRARARSRRTGRSAASRMLGHGSFNRSRHQQRGGSSPRPRLVVVVDELRHGRGGHVEHGLGTDSEQMVSTASGPKRNDLGGSRVLIAASAGLSGTRDDLA